MSPLEAACLAYSSRPLGGEELATMRRVVDAALVASGVPDLIEAAEAVLDGGTGLDPIGARLLRLKEAVAKAKGAA